MNSASATATITARKPSTIAFQSEFAQPCVSSIVLNPSLDSFEYKVLIKYQPKRGSDLAWGKLVLFICGIKNYLQIANVDLANVWSQFNCNIDMIWNQAQVYI